MIDMRKRLLLTTVALLVAAAPLTLAQKPGPRNDKKADTEKKEAPEKKKRSRKKAAEAEAEKGLEVVANAEYPEDVDMAKEELETPELPQRKRRRRRAE